jgi:AhpD family alkylhydroperoxidase
MLTINIINFLYNNIWPTFEPKLKSTEMGNLDKDRIEQLVKTRKKAHSFYLNNSKVYNSFVEMEQNTYKDGYLTKKQKELIAIGISIVIDCESCMEWHIKQALDDGATQNEILESIEVGIEMSGGPGTASARFAMNVLEYYQH